MSRSSLDSIIPARSFTNRPAPISVRHPRVIRADDSRSIDPACLPAQHPSSSPPTPRTRRTSSSATRSHHPPPAPPPSSPVSFPVPSYLDYSALRHLLRTDVSPTFGLAPSVSRTRRAYSPSSDSDEESSNLSPPPREMSIGQAVSPDQPLQLPTRWDAEACHNHLSISDNGRELTFQGTNSNGSDSNAAAARTIQPIPPACGIYYYEVKIQSKGQKAYISIGFAGPDVRTSRLPGWEPNSWGYHGDDGCSFATEKKGTAFGPTYGTDDIIGCGIDFTTHRAFYTKNGSFLGYVFENVGKIPNTGALIPLYPAIGLQHTGESIKVNFGHEPFRFDIDLHVAQQSNQTWERIMSTPLSGRALRGVVGAATGTVGSASAGMSGTRVGAGTEKEQVGDSMATSTSDLDSQTKLTLNKLVISYLAHHGYVKTARTFQKGIQMHDDSAGSASGTGTGDIEMAEASASGASTSAAAGASGSTSGPGSSRGSGSPDLGFDFDFDFEKDISIRTRIVDSVLKGDIDTALEETGKYYPRVFEEDNDADEDGDGDGDGDGSGDVSKRTGRTGRAGGMGMVVVAAEDGAGDRKAQQGLMLVKLRCRKFVEMVLEAAEMKRKMGALDDAQSHSQPHSHSHSHGHSAHDGIFEEDGMDMDVDDDGDPHPGSAMNGVGAATNGGMSSTSTSTSTIPHPSSTSSYHSTSTSSPFPTSTSASSSTHISTIPRHQSQSQTQPSTSTITTATAAVPTTPTTPVVPTKSAYESALQRAISYGQSLDADYRKDSRASVQSIFRKSFSVLAFYDPLEAGGTVGEVAGHEARVELAGELNKAILKSQGRPTRPTLETIYRHTSACIHYLGVEGVGAAAFADMQKEFLEG
ncbi:hypothetical protein D9758_000004 [Tetrapyrgos nigripes]|uniref:SPRY-domain-containing protein n=1 Tax=Tetrapyrgos nigripes TaxID=182062 RepID=A0A8H5H1V8_9AGAR|nr:hypothetical protein D9758_000004 [Tetrapyrgos nigripes]